MIQHVMFINTKQPSLWIPNIPFTQYIRFVTYYYCCCIVLTEPCHCVRLLQISAMHAHATLRHFWEQGKNWRESNSASQFEMSKQTLPSFWIIFEANFQWSVVTESYLFSWWEEEKLKKENNSQTRTAARKGKVTRNRQCDIMAGAH